MSIVPWTNAAWRPLHVWNRNGKVTRRAEIRSRINAPRGKGWSLEAPTLRGLISAHTFLGKQK